MKVARFIFGSVLLLAVAAGVWVVVFHGDWLTPSAVHEEEKAPETEVPVKTARVERATLRRYVEGFGTVEPEPPGSSGPGAGATLTSPVAGVVAAVKCTAGEKVSRGDVLVQLDDRVARAAEEQTAAALQSAKASLDRVKATPRPEQLELAQLVVDKARSTLNFAQKSFERQKTLAETQGSSQKNLELAASELAAAQNELKVAERQLAILKASPTPEDLAEATAKVAEAAGALAAARVQRSMLTVVAPLSGTVTRVGVNVGEGVDATRVLAELVDLDRLVATVAVPSAEAHLLRPDQHATILEERAAPAQPATKSSQSQPSASQPSPTRPAHADAIVGDVRVVGPSVDRKSDSVWAVVSLPSGSGMRPGQSIRLRVAVEEHPDVLAVPVEGVVTTPEGETVVYKVEGDKAAQVPVRVGLREGELEEIESAAIHEGDSVVATGAYGLPPETKVRPIQD
jgi:RND family efflux transporter MFP subunit